MRSDICLAVIGSAAPACLQLGNFARECGLLPVLVFDAPLVDEQHSRVLIVVRQNCTRGPIEVIHCNRSADGPVIAAYTQVEARKFDPPPKVFFRDTHDTILNQFRAPGVELRLCGRLEADNNVLHAVVRAAAQYLKGRNENA